MSDLFLVCTETSGDLLGARLVAELKQHASDLRVFGVAGQRLEAEGMEAIYRVSDFNVMGLVEVLSQLSHLKGMLNELVERVRVERPKAILLIDAPDFNLRFAKAVKKFGIPIIYYVSPQVWAWRKKRAKQIAELVDHMMVLFPFEVEIYKKLGLATTWVGHPLVDELQVDESADHFKARHGLDPNKPLIALAPGSRKSEVTRMLPVMRRVAEARADRYQFAIPLAPIIDQALVTPILAGSSIPILVGEMRPLMFHADAAVVASGTATLETGLLHTPMVVGYRLKRLSYLMASQLVKVPHVALVNIVLGERVVPELIQSDFVPEKILPELDALVQQGPRRDKVLAAFDRLVEILGGGGAAARAAEVVRSFL